MRKRKHDQFKRRNDVRKRKHDQFKRRNDVRKRKHDLGIRRRDLFIFKHINVIIASALSISKGDELTRKDFLNRRHVVYE